VCIEGYAVGCILGEMCVLKGVLWAVYRVKCVLWAVYWVKGVLWAVYWVKCEC